MNRRLNNSEVSTMIIAEVRGVNQGERLHEINLYVGDDFNRINPNPGQQDSDKI